MKRYILIKGIKGLKSVRTFKDFVIVKGILVEGIEANEGIVPSSDNDVVEYMILLGNDDEFEVKCLGYDNEGYYVIDVSDKKVFEVL